MLVAEYDYDLDIEVQREEAFAEGEAHGEARGKTQGEAKLIALIRKKADKEMDANAIADMLELNNEYVKKVLPMLKTLTDLEIAERILTE